MLSSVSPAFKHPPLLKLMRPIIFVHCFFIFKPKLDVVMSVVLPLLWLSVIMPVRLRYQACWI